MLKNECWYYQPNLFIMFAVFLFCSPVPMEPGSNTLPVTAYVNLSSEVNKHGNVCVWATRPEGRPTVTYVP